MSAIAVECATVEGGWVACVTVTDHGSSREFKVGVTKLELARLAPGAFDPTNLVIRAFEFLLEREMLAR
jgi:hypothetical protein